MSYNDLYNIPFFKAIFCQVILNKFMNSILNQVGADVQLYRTVVINTYTLNYVWLLYKDKFVHNIRLLY